MKRQMNKNKKKDDASTSRSKSASRKATAPIHPHHLLNPKQNLEQTHKKT